jgi:hypothetical protein
LTGAEFLSIYIEGGFSGFKREGKGEKERRKESSDV